MHGQRLRKGLVSFGIRGVDLVPGWQNENWVVEREPCKLLFQLPLGDWGDSLQSANGLKDTAVEEDPTV
jgi:hypothetical protein